MTLDIIVFTTAVIGALVLDIFVNRKDKVVTFASAATWSAFWVSLGCAFAGYVYWQRGLDQASLFMSGYLLEKSLSVDNLFVIMAIFSSFAIADKYQHRVLYYGILGAIVLRFGFIAAGSSLLLVGKWIFYVFGAFVLFSAYKMLKSEESEGEIEDYTDHWSVRSAKKIFKVFPRIEGHAFFRRIDGHLMVTPLFLCLIVVEISDIMFAFDSVPVVISITQDLFLIYSSNIFAILGLRSMFFLLVAAKKYLAHLEKAIIAILVYIGIKMILTAADLFHIPANYNLYIVFGALTIGILASIIWPEKEELEQK